MGRFPRGKGTLLDLEFLEDGVSSLSQQHVKMTMLTAAQKVGEESLHLAMYDDASVSNETFGLIIPQHAGFAGAAIALMAWAWQLTHKGEPLPSVSPYENEAALISDVKKAVEEGKAIAGHLPRVLVIGALGRCGRGAVDLCTKAGLQDILVSSES